jgi:hypothetical protein
MRQLVWLDLCSGLGGASQPALDRGWKVIRVDIDPRFKPDIVADVRALPLTRVNSMLAQAPQYPDVLWASPPCTEFSKHGLKCFFPNPPEPDLSIVLGVKAAIANLNPLVWMVENVWPSRPWLTRVFGPVTNRVPGHVLWSNWQILLPNLKPHKGTTADGRHVVGNRDALKKQRPVIAHGPARYGWRADAALIPYEIGEAICRAVEQRNGLH